GQIGISETSPTGRGVKVAVLDTGLWFDHPDFRANRDELRARSKVFAPDVVDASDDYGHGTYCAGLLAGPARPSQAPRYGVAPDVELYVARIFDHQNRAREFDIIEAIDWARGEGCRVVSLSAGQPAGSAPDPEYERLAADTLLAGTVIVAAAGNDSVRPM